MLILFVVCICGISAWVVSHTFSTEIEETGSDVLPEVNNYTDIFEEVIEDELGAYLEVTRTVTDSDSGNKLSGAIIMFINEDGDVEDEALSDENGVFSLKLTVPQIYVFILKADGYIKEDTIAVVVDTALAGQTLQFDVSLTMGTDDEIEVENPDPTERGSTDEFWGENNVMGSLTNSGHIKNSNLKSDSVVTITFLNSLEYMPTDAWDISENGDGTVMAWTSEAGQTNDGDVLYHLYIAGEGGVKASTCCRLFYGFHSVVYINFNRCFDTTDVTDMADMFSGCGNLVSLNMGGINTSNVTDMSGMFSWCSELLALDLSEFNTSSVTDMSEMFAHDRYLRKLDLSTFDTSNVTDMSSLFHYVGVRKLDLNGWDVSNVMDMEQMFAGCSNLVDLNVTDWDVSNVENMTKMFNGCKSLDTLDVSGWDMTNVDTTDMFVGTQWE